MENQVHIRNLFQKYRSRTATQQEVEYLLTYIQSGDDKVFMEELIETGLEAEDGVLTVGEESRERLAQIRQNISNLILADIRSKPVVKRNDLRLWIAFAASLLIVLSVTFYTLNNKKDKHGQYANGKTDLPAGRNAAVLTLGNGRRILLSGAANGQLAKETGVTITKTKDGQLVYEIASEVSQPGNRPGANPGQAVAYNTLSTANGEQYMVILPDLTKVWLNAASSIKFPATFTGLNKRKIELRGEAYFQVKHNSKQPFLVLAKNQIVEDIGTAFNINSYDDEAVVKTTLVEGSARISPSPQPTPYSVIANDAQLRRQSPANEKQASVVLKPGEQAINNGGKIGIEPADTESDLAWKNGDFIFNDEPLESVMRKVSRWYNVEIIYADNVPKHFAIGGFVSRSRPLSVVLETIEKTKKVTFKTEGRKIYVSQ